MDLDFDIFYVSHVLDPKFLDFQVPRFPDFQKSGLGQAWAGPGSEIAGSRPGGVFSAAAPRQLRTTKLGRSKELGQYRENPISASPVWGINCSSCTWQLVLAGVGEQQLPGSSAAAPED